MVEINIHYSETHIPVRHAGSQMRVECWREGGSTVICVDGFWQTANRRRNKVIITIINTRGKRITPSQFV